MSQYRFENETYLFITGYDVQLDFYFLDIEKKNPENDSDAIIFSNLDLANPSMTIPQIGDICEKYMGHLPRDIVEKMKKDRQDAQISGEAGWGIVKLKQLGLLKD